MAHSVYIYLVPLIVYSLVEYCYDPEMWVRHRTRSLKNGADRYITFGFILVCHSSLYHCWVIKSQLATVDCDFTHRWCPSVCPSIAKMQKTRFSQKLSNTELWFLLTTYRKSYMGFSKNSLLDPWNPRWLRSALLKIDITSFFLPWVVRFG